MSEAAQQPNRGGWLKAGLVGLLGLGGGAAGTYATAIVNQVARPTKPVANFAVAADGLTLTCQNHASGESGWWDFGDGTPLEPFDAGQPAVKHTYAKPGNYTVKLTVRNFLADENERSVPVEVAAAATGPPAVPAVLNFAVRPTSAVSVAPATFRITGEVRDAQACVWDFGDGRTETTEAAGKIDRLVTFEKPGEYMVQLFAHNEKQAIKLASPVQVDAAKTGSLSLTLRVTHTGTRAERVTRPASVVVPVPKDGKGGFSRTVAARPGCTFAEASVAAPAGVKNLKVEVAADRRTAVVSGEWDGGAKGSNKAAGGSDVIVPLRLTENRMTAIKPVVNTVGGSTPIGVYAPESSGVRPVAFAPPPAAGSLSFEIPLPEPPGGLIQLNRQLQVEVRQNTRLQPLLQVSAPSLPWSGVFTTADARKWVCSITPDGGKAIVSFNPLAQ